MMRLLERPVLKSVEAALPTRLSFTETGVSD